MSSVLPQIVKGRGLFITGTDTGVGKTLIAGGIAGVLTRAGVKTGVFKPVASGCRREAGQLVSSDAEFLNMCAGNCWPLEKVNHVRFKVPAAPCVCEKAEGYLVDYQAVADAYAWICGRSDFVLVEGIGGFKVPMSEGVDVVDLARWFGLAVLIVARPDLGTLNHTLLTVDAVRSAGLRVAGVVISGYRSENASIAEQTAAEVIERFGDVKVVCVVEYDRDCDTERGMAGGIFEQLEGVDWVGFSVGE